MGACCSGQIGADMKVVFLDFDGVLNSVSYCRLHPEPGVLIDRFLTCFLEHTRIMRSSSAWK